MESSITEFSHLQIPLTKIVEATNNFAEKKIIGKGGFGNVYRGKLMHSGKLIKISARRLDRKLGQGDVEFWTEVSMLSSLKHENIVSLIGFCDEKGEKIIINKHYANGSLLMHLSKPSFTLIQRLDVCHGIARAVEYIHDDLGHSYYVIHRNINSSTILLDEKWKPKLSGFEFSIKHSVDRRNRVVLDETIGTHGYIDPEINKSGGVTHKSDIYCLGVVLFEILTGRKVNEDSTFLAPLTTIDNDMNYDLDYTDEWKKLLQNMIHPDLLNQMGQMSLDPTLYFNLFHCLHINRSKRPDAYYLENSFRMASEDEKEKLGWDALVDRIILFVFVKIPIISWCPKILNFLYKKLIPEPGTFWNYFPLIDADDREPIREIGFMDLCQNIEKLIYDPRKYWNPYPRLDVNDETDEEDLTIREIGFRDVIESALSNPRKVKNFGHLRIQVSEIRLAIDHLHGTTACRSHKLGTVYKTRLKCYDSISMYRYFIIDKRKSELPKSTYKVDILRIRYREDIFKNQIEILGRFRHPNIQSLLGFSDKDRNMILVYKDSCDVFLSEKLRILRSWKAALKICIDVAHGLNYLQNCSDEKKMVIHRDINSDNIVLDRDRRATIVGFDHSLLLPTDVDNAIFQMDEIVGEKNYIDPEYAKTGKLARQSDIYSFGVVMLEIFCGSLVSTIMLNEGHEGEGLAQMVRRWFDEGIQQKKLYSKYKEQNCRNKNFLHKGPNKYSLDTFLEITCMCLAETQNQRPDINFVIQELLIASAFQKNHKDSFKMSFKDIKVATQNFSPANCIGGGGFGVVYKGKVAHILSGDHTIVVKKLDKCHGQGEEQFYNELQILYEYKHENIIGLLGYSSKTNEKLIVYEHATKGSLDKYLNDASLTWRSRLKICIDVATGLDFIHGGFRGQDIVIHRDLKSANILLFDDWSAKIGDFGLSMISAIDKETNFTFDHARGTMGYLDPLYLKSKILTIESDVYSFGVVLFEILYGREVYKISKPKSESLLDYIIHNFKEGKQEESVFESIKKEIRSKSLDKFLKIVQKCLSEDRENRPTSKEVLLQLKKALELQEQDEDMTYEPKLGEIPNLELKQGRFQILFRSVKGIRQYKKTAMSAPLSVTKGLSDFVALADPGFEVTHSRGISIL